MTCTASDGLMNWGCEFEPSYLYIKGSSNPSESHLPAVLPPIAQQQPTRTCIKRPLSSRSSTIGIMAGTSSVTSCESHQRGCCSAQPGNHHDQEKKQPTPTNEPEEDDDDDDQWGDGPGGDLGGRGTRDKPTIGVKGSNDPKFPTEFVKK